MKKTSSIIISISIFIATISVIAILIARGYTFSNNQISENGMLKITSKPEGAIIKINGENRGKTPKKIELNPNIYKIKIEKENYKSWNKQITVEASLVKEISPILYPEELDIEQFTFINAQKAYFSKDGEIGILTDFSENNDGLWLTKLEKTIFDLSDSQLHRVTSTNFMTKTCRQNYTISISPQNKYALMKCKAQEYSQFFLFDLANKNTTPININSKLNFNPNKITFGHNSTLIIETKTFILGHDIDSQKNTFITYKQNSNTKLTKYGNSYLSLIQSFDQKEKFIFKLSEDFTKIKITAKDIKQLDSIETIYSSANNSELVIFQDNKKTYLYNLETFKVIQKFANNNTNILSFSPNGENILFVEENKLKTLNIQELPNNETEIIIKTIIKDYSNDLFVTKWSPNSNKLILNDKNKNEISLVDKDGNNKETLFSEKITQDTAFYFSENETFFVVLVKDEKDSSNLFSIKLSI